MVEIYDTIDVRSRTWLAVTQVLNHELEDSRSRLEHINCDNNMAQMLRGRIAVVKELLELAGLE